VGKKTRLGHEKKERVFKKGPKKERSYKAALRIKQQGVETLPDHAQWEAKKIGDQVEESYLFF